jgi:hypothetical protein
MWNYCTHSHNVRPIKVEINLPKKTWQRHVWLPRSQRNQGDRFCRHVLMRLLGQKQVPKLIYYNIETRKRGRKQIFLSKSSRFSRFHWKRRLRLVSAVKLNNSIPALVLQLNWNYIFCFNSFKHGVDTTGNKHCVWMQQILSSSLCNVWNDGLHPPIPSTHEKSLINSRNPSHKRTASSSFKLSIPGTILICFSNCKLNTIYHVHTQHA